jgi:FkbM family methyltransferase
MNSLNSKPKFWNNPRAWLKRKIRQKIGDAVRPLRLRVLEQVDFTFMRSQYDFAHIIDVGVADGSSDLYSRFPRAYLDLFEPSPQHKLSLSNFLVTSREGRLHPIALGKEEGSAVLHLTGRTGSSFFNAAHARRDYETATVPVRRLDAVLSGEELQRPCLLKIDTEGFEYQVLLGAEKLLPFIDTIVVEIHFDKPFAYTPGTIVNFLSQHGFEISDMLDHYVKNDNIECADIVFERTEKT